MTILGTIMLASLGDVPIGWWLAPVGAIAALVAAYIFYQGIMKEEEDH